MQAIITKYLPATNTRGQRVKATCARGSLTVSCGAIDEALHARKLRLPAGLCQAETQHVAAAQLLCNRFVAEDTKRDGPEDNAWGRPRVSGCLPSGDYAHVFISR